MDFLFLWLCVVILNVLSVVDRTYAMKLEKRVNALEAEVYGEDN